MADHPAIDCPNNCGFIISSHPDDHHTCPIRPNARPCQFCGMPSVYAARCQDHQGYVDCVICGTLSPNQVIVHTFGNENNPAMGPPDKGARCDECGRNRHFCEFVDGRYICQLCMIDNMQI